MSAATETSPAALQEIIATAKRSRGGPAAPPEAPGAAPPDGGLRPTPAQRPHSVAWRYAVAVIGIVLLGIGLLIMVALRGGGEDAGARTPDEPSLTSIAAFPTVIDPPAPNPASTIATPAVGVAPTAEPSTASPTPGAATSPDSSAAPTDVPKTSAAPSPPTTVRQEVIVYTAQRSGENAAFLYAVTPDGTKQRQVTPIPGQAWGPQIATDQRSVVFSIADVRHPDHPAIDGLVGKGNHDLYLVNTDGSAPVRLTTTTAWNAAGSWSPGGTTLAFTSDRDGDWEIYTLTFPAGKLSRLTNNPAQDGWPTWTPDGKRLVFMSTRDGLAQLYTMNADGSAVRRFFRSASNDSFPVVSPDGTKIAFASETPGGHDPDIFVIGIDGSNVTQLTTSGDNGQPTWSPDGTRLAFVSTRDGAYNIYTMRADGSAQTRVTQDVGAAMTPTWGFLVLPTAAPAGADPARSPLTSAAAGWLLLTLPLGGVLPRRRARPAIGGRADADLSPAAPRHL